MQSLLIVHEEALKEMIRFVLEIMFVPLLLLEVFVVGGIG